MEKKRGITQNASAKKTDIPYTTIAKIAEGLGITIDDLIKS